MDGGWWDPWTKDPGFVATCWDHLFRYPSDKGVRVARQRA